jgi:alpha-beta hydrolase superfamily lysophospholipase
LTLESASVRRERGPLERRRSKGPRLYFTATTPGSAIAVVGLLHGFAEYGERYAHVAGAWAERGISTITLDMRGHGRAEGRRGYCDRFEQYRDDASELEALVRDRSPEVPAFLFGHSFGALVATSYTLSRGGDWRGLVLSAPGFGFAVPMHPLKRLAGVVISRFVPAFGLPSGLHGKDVTHDEVIARKYDEDPLCFKKARARWFTEALAEQARVRERAPSLQLPLYIAMGTADRVADFSVARSFFAAAGTRDKTFDQREGLFHEILNEAEWPQIAARMADWMLARA